jgi:hypothetical protein
MVTMMDVGVVWVGMRQARVLMAVRVGFAWRVEGRMFVLVMLVVIVKVFVLSRRSAGPATPPARVASASHGRRESGVSTRSIGGPARIAREIARPIPEPR